MELVILGSLPPPLGGVSVYCKRKVESERQKNRKVNFYNSKKYAHYLKLVMHIHYLKLTKVDYEFEINVTNVYVLFLVALLGAASGSIFFDHNASRNYRSKIKKWMFHFYLSKVSIVKLVNEELKKHYPKKLYQQITFVVTTPYVRPSELEVNHAKHSLPIELKNKLSGKRNFILNTAWKPVDTLEEPDLYGLMLTLDLYAYLCPKFSNYEFLLAIGSIEASPYCNTLLEKANALSRFPNFTFVTDGINQLGILDNTKLYLRLTKTDGDSLSVREALDFGCCVIATDVASRPDGVIKTSNDYDEVLSNVIKVIS